MSLILLILVFIFTFLLGMYLAQKISKRLILNFKIIFITNIIIFCFFLSKFNDLNLVNFIILLVNFVLFKFIFLITLQASISSIQLQILFNLNRFGKINNKYNDKQIFQNRFKNFKESQVFKIVRKKYIRINKSSIFFVYYFFLVLKKIYNEKM
ncbi:unknown membrane protein [Candidatus Pelagibacter ubique HTCC1002]|uniref:Transmembrane protein n=2 Tax=Pelagibacter ubique TaxID=198252 RepID=Q4FN74_PELUB|nr:hypothetical protein [Candidatus Pelagibacter ubique]AAZ21365.1 unknown membrane protein [Candidatus Pelagibacter ubique HTCC1062]EAS84773.1 unknown membrane protein [Candidatus Pelagibacter ubique HTCC1002]